MEPTHPIDPGPPSTDRPAFEAAGTQIGAYRLVDQVGHGGFGTVWRAVRERPFEQQVAVKLIKLGMDSEAVLARFDHERRAMALIDHPGIARAIDGGITDRGRAYFVMEFVGGLPITEFCDRHTLPLHERSPGLGAGLRCGPACAPARDHSPRSEAIEHTGAQAR